MYGMRLQAGKTGDCFISRMLLDGKTPYDVHSLHNSPPLLRAPFLDHEMGQLLITVNPRVNL